MLLYTNTVVDLDLIFKYYVGSHCRCFNDDALPLVCDRLSLAHILVCGKDISDSRSSISLPAFVVYALMLTSSELTNVRKLLGGVGNCVFGNR